MSADEFQCEVRFVSGFDHRDFPDDGRGAKSMVIAFILRGRLGVIEADVNTGWMHRPLVAGYIPGGQQVRRPKPGVDARLVDHYPEGVAIHSHSLEQRRDWWFGPSECGLLGGSCYGDTGYIVSDKFFDLLVGDGEEAAWGYLEEIYADWLPAEIGATK